MFYCSKCCREDVCFTAQTVVTGCVFYCSKCCSQDVCFAVQNVVERMCVLLLKM